MVLSKLLLPTLGEGKRPLKPGNGEKIKFNLKKKPIPVFIAKSQLPLLLVTLVTLLAVTMET